MRRRGGGSVSAEFPVETEEGKELVFHASAKSTPYVPARLHPVDLSHPAEGGDIEDIELELDGKSITMKEAVALGLDEEKLEERLAEAAGEQDDFVDRDDYEDPFDD